MISWFYTTEYHDVKYGDVVFLCLSVVGLTTFSLSTIGLSMSFSAWGMSSKLPLLTQITKSKILQ
jgi:hypothetical protein